MLTKVQELLIKYIEEYPSLLQQRIKAQELENPWFTEEFQQTALEHITRFFNPKHIEKVFRIFRHIEKRPKTIGTILAGNIPLVGFQDILSVLLSGHRVQIKSSSKDSILLHHILDKMIEFEPDLSNRIERVERIKNIDAVIATGSNTSSKYFEYYFSKYPRIIRKNRTSIAIISTHSTNEDLALLGDDIFTYFGLGCRNVSTLFIPEGLDIRDIMQQWQRYEYFKNHHKYSTNYQYRKIIAIMNNMAHYDNGFVLLENSDNLFSHIGVLHFQYYKNIEKVRDIIASQSENLQCIVATKDAEPKAIPFGSTQCPNLFDFQDGINTFKFLNDLYEKTA